MPWPELWTRRRPPDRHDRGLPVQVQADQVEISQGTPGRRQGRGASAFAAAAAEAEASTRRRLPESAWDGEAMRDAELAESSRGPPRLEERVQSTDGFRTYHLKRRVVIRIVRVVVGVTIACVIGSTALLLWGLVMHGMQMHMLAWWTAGVAAAVAIPISLHEIVMHMLHYVQPDQQKYYIRILWMVPIYAVESWMALRFKTQSKLLETLRETYEGFVIYSFFQLLLQYLGGQQGILEVFRRKDREHALMPWPFGWVKSWRYEDGSFVENCRIGVFLFVFVRLLSAVLTLVVGYMVSPDSPHQRYVRRTMTVLINLAQIAALTCLVVFYHDLKEELRPLRPLGKFLAVKAVVFFSFWQGLLIYTLVHTGVIRSSQNWTQEEIGKGIQSYALCWEMAVAAVAHTFVFSYTDFEHHFDDLGEHVRKSHVTRALQDMILQRDLAHETVHHVSKVIPTTLPRAIMSGAAAGASSASGSLRGMMMMSSTMGGSSSSLASQLSKRGRGDSTRNAPSSLGGNGAAGAEEEEVEGEAGGDVEQPALGGVEEGEEEEGKHAAEGGGAARPSWPALEPISLAPGEQPGSSSSPRGEGAGGLEGDERHEAVVVAGAREENGVTAVGGGGGASRRGEEGEGGQIDRLGGVSHHHDTPPTTTAVGKPGHDPRPKPEQRQASAHSEEKEEATQQ